MHSRARVTEEIRYQALTAQLADNRQALHEAQERYRRGQVVCSPCSRTKRNSTRRRMHR
jgi:hypothetical protein